MTPPRATAIILARAGSKGVPGKNRALVAGRPCACWTIDDARAAHSVSRIVLSTDDAELQRLGVALGVDVVARPPALAADDTPVDAAARHALEAISETHTPHPLVLLYANVPVRPRGLIDRAVRLLVESRADSVQSFARVGKHHPWWTVRIEERTGALRPWEGAALFHNTYRRQDLPPAFIPDGGVIACTTDALMLRARRTADDSPHAFLGADRRAVTTNEGDVIDIDSPLDLIFADAILRARPTTHSETAP